MAEIGDIAGLANVIQAVGGSSTKQTQQTKVTPEAITRMVNDILAGESGVGRIGSATRKSGLYNSSTQELLLNDLISRASARGALANAPTTTKTDVEGAGLVPTIATLAGTAMLNSAITKGISSIFSARTPAEIVEAIPTPAAIIESVPTPPSAMGPMGPPLPASLQASGPLAGLTSTLKANAIPGLGGLAAGLLEGEDAFDAENLLLTAGIPALFGGLPAAGTALLGAGVGAFGGDILSGVADIGKNIVSGIGDFFGGLF